MSDFPIASSPATLLKFLDALPDLPIAPPKSVKQQYEEGLAALLSEPGYEGRVDDIDPAGDVATLARLKASKDGRSLSQMLADEGYEDVVAVKVTTFGNEGGSQEVSFESETGEWSTGFKGGDIKVGDTIRMYGGPVGWGGARSGFAVNGKLIEFETPWERFVNRRMRWFAGNDRRDREALDENRDAMDAAYEALPPPMKKRIDRLREEDPTFRVSGEGYEMAACGDAPLFASAIAREKGWTLDENCHVIEEVTVEEIQEAVSWFSKLPWDDQKALVPDMDDGHSGNTFGFAVYFAGRLLAGLEL